MRLGIVQARISTHPEPTLHLRVDIDTGVIAIVRWPLAQPLRIVISARHIIWGRTTHPLERYICRMRRCILVVYIFPPLKSIVAIRIAQWLHLCIGQTPNLFLKIVILRGREMIFIELIRSQHTHPIWSTQIHVTTLLCRAPLFGSNVNHPIGSTRTIDRCSRCICKHVNTLKIIGIETCDTVNRNPIYYVQRLRIPFQRTSTMQRKRSSCRGFTTHRRYRKSCHLPRQSI